MYLAPLVLDSDDAEEHQVSLRENERWAGKIKSRATMAAMDPL